MVNKKILSLINIAMIVLVLFVSFSTYAQGEGNVYVVPIKNNITKSTFQFVESKVNEIMKYNPSAIIFEIDTYGGYINEAEKIWKLISSLDVPTIAYVNTKAESAGVLITISNDKIVMTKGATVGSAETIPNTEKVLSMWVSWLKEAAENNGRNPELVAAMADKSIEIPGVVKKGKLLNLNSNDANRLGFADLIANDYEEALDYFDIEYNDIVEETSNLRTKLAGFLSDPAIGGVLITIGFIGLVFEIMMPGFGAGGTLSLIAFSLFFSGNILAGNSGLGVIIIFLAGIALIFIEAVIPGFGVVGIGGMIAIGASIVLAMGSVQAAVISLFIAIIISTIVLALLIKFGYKSPYLNRVILKENQNRKLGYVGVPNKNEYLGKEGEVISYLRPAGTVLIENDRVDAVSQSEFIKKGERVKVVKVEGSKVIVRKIN